jgi:hypothetical protein
VRHQEVGSGPAAALQLGQSMKPRPTRAVECVRRDGLRRATSRGRANRTRGPVLRVHTGQLWVMSVPALSGVEGCRERRRLAGPPGTRPPRRRRSQGVRGGDRFPALHSDARPVSAGSEVIAAHRRPARRQEVESGTAAGPAALQPIPLILHLPPPGGKEFRMHSRTRDPPVRARR